MTERLKVTVLKTVMGNTIVGSNPTHTYMVQEGGQKRVKIEWGG